MPAVPRRLRLRRAADPALAAGGPAPDPSSWTPVLLEDVDAVDPRERGLLFDANGVVPLNEADLHAFKASMDRVLDAYACLGLLNVPSPTAESSSRGPCLSVDSYLVLVTSASLVGTVNLTRIVRITGVELVCLGRRGEAASHSNADQSRTTLSPDDVNISEAQRQAVIALFKTGQITEDEVLDMVKSTRKQSQAAVASTSTSRENTRLLVAIRETFATGTFFYAEGRFDLARPLSEQPPTHVEAGALRDAADYAFMWNLHSWQELVTQGVAAHKWLVSAIRGQVWLTSFSVDTGIYTAGLICRHSAAGAREPWSGPGLVDGSPWPASLIQVEQFIASDENALSSLTGFISLPAIHIHPDKLRPMRTGAASAPSLRRLFSHLQRSFGSTALVLLPPRGPLAESMTEFESGVSFVASDCKVGAVRTSADVYRQKDVTTDKALQRGLMAALISQRPSLFDGSNQASMLTAQQDVLVVVTPDMPDRYGWQVLQLGVTKVLESQMQQVKLEPTAHRARLEADLRTGWSFCSSQMPGSFAYVHLAEQRQALQTIAGASPSLEAERLCQLADVTLTYGCGCHLRAQQQRLSDLSLVMQDAVQSAAQISTVHTACLTWSADNDTNALASLTAVVNHWLKHAMRPSEGPSPQLVVLAVQDLAELDNAKFWPVWWARLGQMGAAHELILTSSTTTGTSAMFLLTSSSLLPRLSRLSTGSVSLNKSLTYSTTSCACGLSLQIDDSALCFVNVLLTGGQAALHGLRREQELKTVLNHLSFGGRQLPLRAHEHVVILGNFNSRLVMPVRSAKAAVEILARSHLWSALAEQDQLWQWMRAGGLMSDFHESDLRFPLTYRSDKTEQLNWCDRILYSERNSALKADMLEYTSWPLRNDTGSGSLSGSLVSSRGSSGAITVSGAVPTEALGRRGGSSTAVDVGPSRTRHWPVSAKLSFQIGCLNQQELMRLRDEYIAETGPLDPTVCVTSVEDLDVDNLRSELEKHGPIDQMHISGCFAFVTYRSAAAAEKCAADGHPTIEGRLLDVRLRPLGRPSKPLQAADLPAAPLLPLRRRKKKAGDEEASLTPGTPATLLPTTLWLVGGVPEDEAVAWLKKVSLEGAFLVRHGERPGADTATTPFTISLIAKSLRHVKIKRGDGGTFLVKQTPFKSLEDVVQAYRRQPLIDDVPLTYPVNAITAAAFEASLSLSKPQRMAVRALFDLETAKRRLLRKETRLQSFKVQRHKLSQLRQGTISVEDVLSSLEEVEDAAEHPTLANISSGDSTSDSDDDAEAPSPSANSNAASSTFPTSPAAEKHGAPLRRNKAKKAGRDNKKKRLFASFVVRGDAVDEQRTRDNAAAETGGNDRAVEFVQQCIAEVERCGMEEEGIYRVAGVSSQYLRLYRDCYEANKAVSQVAAGLDISAVTSALKHFFRNSETVLVPPAQRAQLVELAAANDLSTDAAAVALRTILGSLPSKHFEIFRMLLQHLRRVADQATVNKMTPHNLGVVFGPSLLRSADVSADFLEIGRLGKLVEAMIVHCGLIFAAEEPQPAAMSRSVSVAGSGDVTSRLLGTVEAAFDFEGGLDNGEYYLSFSAGDQLESVYELDQGDWLWGYHPQREEWGFIPRNHLQL